MRGPSSGVEECSRETHDGNEMSAPSTPSLSRLPNRFEWDGPSSSRTFLLTPGPLGQDGNGE